MPHYVYGKYHEYEHDVSLMTYSKITYFMFLWSGRVWCSSSKDQNGSPLKDPCSFLIWISPPPSKPVAQKQRTFHSLSVWFSTQLETADWPWALSGRHIYWFYHIHTSSTRWLANNVCIWFVVKAMTLFLHVCCLALHVRHPNESEYFQILDLSLAKSEILMLRSLCYSF